MREEMREKRDEREMRERETRERERLDRHRRAQISVSSI